MFGAVQLNSLPGRQYHNILFFVLYDGCFLWTDLAAGQVYVRCMFAGPRGEGGRTRCCNGKKRAVKCGHPLPVCFVIHGRLCRAIVSKVGESPLPPFPPLSPPKQKLKKKNENVTVKALPMYPRRPLLCRKKRGRHGVVAVGKRVTRRR